MGGGLGIGGIGPGGVIRLDFRPVDALVVVVRRIRDRVGIRRLVDPDGVEIGIEQNGTQLRRQVVFGLAVSERQRRRVASSQKLREILCGKSGLELSRRGVVVNSVGEPHPLDVDQERVPLRPASRTGIGGDDGLEGLADA